MTDAERKLWWSLRQVKFRGSHFRRQATIGPFITDFACHARKLIIELDGGQHAEDPQATRDRLRDAYFEQHGYRVLRFWNGDVMNNVEGVATVIVDALERASPPTPDPSPPLASARGGRGVVRQRIS